MPGVYRWVEHTAELGLEIRADSEAAVFHEALAALRELVADEPPGGEPVSRNVHVEAADRAALLAEWLSELVFLAETERLVPLAAESLELGERQLYAVVRGARGEPRPLVKAVTYHGLRLEREGAGWRASLVLDV